MAVETIESNIQAVANLRTPIKEDKSFFEGADMGAVIKAAMLGEEVRPALNQLSDRFIDKHQGQAQKAVPLGAKVGKAIHEGGVT